MAKRDLTCHFECRYRSAATRPKFLFFFVELCTAACLTTFPDAGALCVQSRVNRKFTFSLPMVHTYLGFSNDIE